VPRWLVLVGLLGACTQDAPEDTRGSDTDADTDADADTGVDLLRLTLEVLDQSECHAKGPPSLEATSDGHGNVLVNQANIRSRSSCPVLVPRARLDPDRQRIMVELRDVNDPCKGDCFLDLSYAILHLLPGTYTVVAPGGEAVVTVEEPTPWRLPPGQRRLPRSTASAAAARANAGRSHAGQ
jgi:hypothetical protein